MGPNSNLPCDISEVIDLVGIQVIRNTGTQLHCRCPFCGDRKAHMNVKIAANVFRCNRCGCGGGVLHLYAMCNDISLNAAYEELCRIFTDKQKPRQKRLYDKQGVATTELHIAPASVRNNTYSNLLSLLSLGSAHREALLKRGLSGESIARVGYKTTPAVRTAKIVTELIERGCELKGVPGFYCDSETGQWKLDIRGSGIMVPDRNIRGEIEAIQIRLDKVYKSKFLNLTSAERYCGTTAACCPHFVGMQEDTTAVYLTEGVMKADIARCLSAELGQPRTFVGLTGVANSNQILRAFDELGSHGVKDIYVAFDMDALVNENVARAREKVLETGCQIGFEMTPMFWNPSYKGIDDLLLSFKDRKLALEAIRAT